MISADSITHGRLDYEQFCSGPAAPTDISDEGLRLSADAFHSRRDFYNVFDVRDRVHFEIAHLSNSINVPMEKHESYDIKEYTRPIVVVCRLGADSRIAARNLRSRYPHLQIWDLEGGLQAYSSVDRNFPLY